MTPEEIKNKRVELAVSQLELAEAAGLTRKTVNAIENRTDVDTENIKYRKSIKKIEEAFKQLEK